jgi:hypothetical protein
MAAAIVKSFFQLSKTFHGATSLKDGYVRNGHLAGFLAGKTSPIKEPVS